MVFPVSTQILFAYLVSSYCNECFILSTILNCVAAVERLPALHYSVDFIFMSFEIMGSLRNFETIRGSLMKPKWQKLGSLAQEICTL